MIDALDGPPKNVMDDEGSIALLMEENIKTSNNLPKNESKQEEQPKDEE